MSFVIEPRCISCVYQEDPYVGRGLTARWFVLDEETGAVLANNGGKGYASFSKAFLAYQWQSKGLPAIKIAQAEQEMLYEWSLKNKILTDRLDRISMYCEQEGKELTCKHVTVLFNTNHVSCPTEADKFLVAYKNDFYKDAVLKRREQQAKQDAIRKKWNLKQKLSTYMDNNETVNKIREHSDRVAVMLDPVKTYIHEHMKAYEERPQEQDAVSRTRMLSHVSPVEIANTGTTFVGHEWEIVEEDFNANSIFDTFGQDGPANINRIMDRQYHPQTNSTPQLVNTTMVDPISYQIVQYRTSRCVNAQEWQQMAGERKKKKKKTILSQPPITESWVGAHENSTPPQKDISQSSSHGVRTDMGQPKTNMATKNKTTKGQRERPSGLPPKQKPVKKSPIGSKIKSLKEEWLAEDEEYDDEEYDIPTLSEAFSQMKDSIHKFFSDIKEEADKQRAEEQAQKAAKKQEKCTQKK